MLFCEGVACHLAWQEALAGRKIGGLILQSPLMSAYRIALHFRFSMFGDKFVTIDKIGAVKAPVFIIHGTRDEVVPFHHGQELFLAVNPRYRYKVRLISDSARRFNFDTFLCL